MIEFWSDEAGHRTLNGYAAGRGREVAALFRARAYSALGAATAVSGGAQLFSATDRLTAAQRAAVAALWDAHARRFPDAPRLNDPRRALDRFDLIRALHGAGLSRLRAYRVREADAIRQFPVFVRYATRHGGFISPLLRSAGELSESLRGLAARGARSGELMIAEFCDTADGNGWYTKYSAYRVGGRILPCHIMRSRSWIVRAGSNELDAAAVHAEIDYLTNDPHQAWLRQVFELAGIDYGRIDYGLIGGEPVAWEINVSPTLGRGSGDGQQRTPDHVKPLKAQARAIFHSRLREAFAALSPGEVRARETLDVRLDAGLLDRIQHELRQRERDARRQRWISRLSAHPLSRPVGAILRRLFSPGSEAL